MNRPIKFRAWLETQQRMFTPLRHLYVDGQLTATDPESSFISKCLMQFTGLKDKRSVEIYEGDILEYRTPSRRSQTHRGDNIPLGEYTEPLEPTIQITRHVVKFVDGMLTCDDDGDPWPLSMTGPFAYDLSSAKEGFDGWNGYQSKKFSWNDPGAGDLQYLLSEYEIADEDALIDFLGVTVIGNIYENPDLLK